MSEQKHKIVPLEEFAVIGSELLCIATFMISAFKNIINVFIWKFDVHMLLLTAASMIIFTFLSLDKFFWLNWSR